MTTEIENMAPVKVLVLRTCTAEMGGTHQLAKGFVWPESGPVACSDWNPEPICGYGLHGLLWGCGDGSLLAFNNATAKWLVVEVLASEIVLLEGGSKVKFPRGEVVFCGDRKGATDFIYSLKPGAVAGVSTIVADQQSALGGYASTVTGGDASTVTGGYASTVTGGARSKVTGGARSKVTGGDASTVTGGYASTVTGGYASTVTGGDDSTLCLRHWDGKRWRLLIGYVGESGIEPGKPYKVNAQGEIVPAEAAK
jgi:hypothetical protein